MKTTVNGNKLQVSSDYSPAMVTESKKLGGKWNPDKKTWDFDIRDEELVRAMLLKVFGTNGKELAIETVRVRIELDKITQETMFGRVLYSRTGRDDPVRLHSSVVAIAGGFYSSGGSAKNPSCDPKPGTIIEVKDVPRAMAENYIQDGISIVSIDSIDPAALQAEKARLTARIIEIDRLIAG